MPSWSSLHAFPKTIRIRSCGSRPRGEVRYANAAANVLVGRIGADPALWAQWQDALQTMRGIGRTERRFEIGDRVYLLSAVTDSSGCLNLFSSWKLPISSPRNVRSARAKRAWRW